jgi:hypothetical protein
MFKVGDKVVALESVFEEREDDDGDLVEEEVIVEGDEYQVVDVNDCWLVFRYVDGEYTSRIFKKVRPIRNLPAWF